MAECIDYFRVLDAAVHRTKITENTRHRPNAGPMLCQRRRRGHNIASTLSRYSCLLGISQKTRNDE